MDKMPAPSATEGTSQKRLPKKIVALKYLLRRSLIQPEAHELYGESCLHSTISTLANDHNLVFERVPEKYGRFNARFTRYTLQEESRVWAEWLIDYYTC
ncbi:hypothetical protein ACFVYJ_12575 [Pontibacter sp. JAM-7]|uniref:hypothetical protein n=1 Tax=Pontibacter sp. JAM-7 TaxID=3366581 RepID=UPI003AF4A268